MIRRIITAALSAAVLLTSASATNTLNESDQIYPARLSPSTSLEIDSDGYLSGIVGIPTADHIISQFDGEVTVTSPDGTAVTGDAPVPSDSTVICGTEIIARVAVPGDPDRDGKVTLSDAASALRMIANWDQDICDAAADADGSGSVSLADVALMLQYIAGWNVTVGKPLMLDLSADSGYVILANGQSADSAIADSMGFEIADAIPEGQPFITVGTDLCEKYTFIDSAAVNALFPGEGYICAYGDGVYMTAENDAGIAKCVELLTSGNGSAIPKGYTGTVGHLTGEAESLYTETAERIAATELKHDGTNELTDDIMTALANADYTEPKNFILMIGDGMGFGAVNGAEITYRDQLPDGILAMNHLPVQGSATTYAADAQITDSAAGGTALSTGYKTSNSTVAMDQAHENDLRSLTELASELGKSTGIVATYTVVDATPAVFSIHGESRSKMNAAGGKQLRAIAEGTLDLVFGGGHIYYTLEENKQALDEAVAAGLTFTGSMAEAKAASLPVAGLFAEYGINTTYGNGAPTLAEMTDVALDKLSEDEDGFFLMVEGSQIDIWAHNNIFDGAMSEVYEFDCAVAVAMRYVALNPDTVLIITADHETGGLIVYPDSTPEDVAERSQYTRQGHSWSNVPVFAVGYGTGALERVNDNTDISILIAELMGERDHGYRSTVTELLDLSDPAVAEAVAELNPEVTVTEDGVIAHMNKDLMEVTLPINEIDVSPETYRNARAIHVTYRNVGEVAKNTLNLQITTPDGTVNINEWWTFVDPGETVTFSHILPAELWEDGALADMLSMKLTCSVRADFWYEILDVSVTDRPLGK